MTQKKKRLILFLTMKCNIECRHCAVNSSPKRSELMDYQEAKSYIDQAYKAGFTALTFTGGECFLYPELLLSLIKAGAAYKMYISCVTNCFWGKHQEQARRTVTQLKEAGLSLLDLSIDIFHEAFLPYSVFENVLIEANRQNLPVLVKSTGTYNQFMTDKVYQSIKNHALHQDIITLQEITCMPMGAAKDNLGENEFFRIGTDFLEDSLCPLTEDFIITPSGEAYPCCSPGGFTPPLKMGNVLHHGLSQALKNYPTPELSLMETYGPVNVAKAIIGLGSSFTLKENYTSFCEVCHDLLETNETAAFCRQLTSFNKKEIKEFIKIGDEITKAHKALPATIEDMYEELKKIPQDPIVTELFHINDELNTLEEGLLTFKQSLLQEKGISYSDIPVQPPNENSIHAITKSKNNNFL